MKGSHHRILVDALRLPYNDLQLKLERDIMHERNQLLEIYQDKQLCEH